ncbi:MAG TPA: TRIC cation channel family protein [Propionibacteriaceae bacterium]|nr:TRIC cation channel family protein [Propionibacteriaceae bacterium]
MPHDVSLMFRVVDLSGVLLNGILGGMVARERRFDIVGFVLLAIVSALGGGLMRDVLLQAGRPLALTDPHYLLFALAGAVIAYVVNLRGRLWNILFPVADALALGTWAATGATRSLQVGVGWLPALFLGLATAVGGGSIRDVAVGRVPAIFGGNRLYAVPAMLSAAIIVVGHELRLSSQTGLVVAALAGAALALAAHIFGWGLPVHGDGTLTGLRGRFGPRAQRGRRSP